MNRLINNVNKVFGSGFLAMMFVAIVLTIGYLIFNTGSMNAYKKNLQADIRGGLTRTVTVYSSNGIPIKSWEGTIDIASNDNWVNMLINGERKVIIKGGITIVEEHPK